MIGIEDIINKKEFRELPNGYSYKILAFNLNGVLCNINLELREDETQAGGYEEHTDVMDNIINDVLNFEYFIKMKVDKYDPNYIVNEKSGNIYSLNFTIVD